MNKKNERILCFDVVRGFCLFLALWQHYAFYLNYWFVHFFKETDLLNSFYKIYEPLMGKQLPVDDFSHSAALFFTPVVSQIFLTLASFNLAKYTEHEFKLKFNQKITMFIILFFVFSFENFIVADSLGEALSLYPVMTWMIILSILSLVFRLIGFKGVLVLQIISLFYLINPEMLSSFEIFIQDKIHPDFNLDANPLYFLPSACMGFILGHLFYHKKAHQFQKEGLFILGLVLFILGYMLSPSFYVNYYDVLESEHFKSYYLFGVLEVLGVQMMIIQSCLFLSKMNIPKVFNVFIWIGQNSFLIFFFHRIFFVFIYMPILLFIGAYLDLKIIAHIGYILPSIFLEFLFCYLVLKSKILLYLGKETHGH